MKRDKIEGERDRERDREREKEKEKEEKGNKTGHRSLLRLGFKTMRGQRTEEKNKNGKKNTREKKVDGQRQRSRGS